MFYILLCTYCFWKNKLKFNKTSLDGLLSLINSSLNVVTSRFCKRNYNVLKLFLKHRNKCFWKHT